MRRTTDHDLLIGDASGSSPRREKERARLTRSDMRTCFSIRNSLNEKVTVCALCALSSSPLYPFYLLWNDLGKLPRKTIKLPYSPFLACP